MGSIKIAVGCFAGCFASVIGFGMTYDWMKRKSSKPKSGVKDAPEPKSGEVPLGDEKPEA